MKRKLPFLFALLIAGITLGVVFMSINDGQRIFVPEVTTQAIIRQTYHGLSILMQDEGLSFEAATNLETQSASVNATITAQLRSIDLLPKPFGAKAARATLNDAWDQPLNLLLVKHLISTASNSPLLSITNPLAIWSNGPNKSNEWGNGDDVVFIPR